jgi:hypothetical protein
MKNKSTDEESDMVIEAAEKIRVSFLESMGRVLRDKKLDVPQGLTATYTAIAFIIKDFNIIAHHAGDKETLKDLLNRLKDGCLSLYE